MLRLLNALLLVLLLASVARGEPEEPAPAPTPVDLGTAPVLRVLVYQGQGELRITGPQGVQVEQEGLPPIQVDGLSLPPAAQPASTGLEGHWLLRGPGGILALDGRTYRGDLEAWIEAGTLLVVNRVCLEDYLRGVVPRELLSSQVEAVKAQAVLARTYALAHRKPGDARWDVRDDTSHQVYGGVEAEHPTSDRAVLETAGQVLAWRGRLADRVVYHSTCGGRTEGNQPVFGTPPIPYLQGVECVDEAGRPGCSASKYATWTADWEGKDLGQELGRFLGKPVPAVRGLEIREAAPSGRVVRLAVLLEGGGELELGGDDLRRALRYREASGQLRALPSTRFLVEPEAGEGRIRVQGSGWGHGVGMCQWGAIGMARQGSSYAEILGRYYPGALVVPVGEMEPSGP